jgi:hypothetical protein
MKTRIYSYGTFLYKIIFPIAIFMINILIILILITSKDLFLLTPLCFVILMDMLCYHYGIRLKRVWMINDKLIIKDFRKEILVEKWEISRVTQNIPFIVPRYVRIYFKWDTKFGKCIVFIPRRGLTGSWNNFADNLLKWKDS